MEESRKDAIRFQRRSDGILWKPLEDSIRRDIAIPCFIEVFQNFRIPIRINVWDSVAIDIIDYIEPENGIA